MRYIAGLCGSRRLDSRIRLLPLINTHQTGPSNSKALRRYRSERALRCEGPALSVNIGVKGSDMTDDNRAHQRTSHAYGAVQGTWGKCVVDLVGWLWCVYAGVNTYFHAHLRCECICSQPRRGATYAKATTIHESGMCLGTIQTTGDTLATIFTAVNRACS